ncbi:hypothetical protein H4582DRAFT_2171276 [Lactarius indigo]|nr:hypothetical protein H4582DRAFT_2171276 [Lactarius indigo]
MSTASYTFTSNIDPALIGNHGDFPINPHSHRQYDSGSERPRSHMGSNYSPDLEEVISNASVKMLENSGHFIRIQMTSEKRAMEITKLEEALAIKTKENDDLKEENQVLKVEINALKGAIKLFAKEYHESTSGGHINGVLSSLRTGTVPAKPALRKRTDYPTVVQWTKKDFRCMSAKKGNAKRGETDGNATSARQKGKRGRPRKDKDPNKDPNDDIHVAHPYLENEDGTPVDADVIADMSRKARMLWATLDEDGMAPPTWGGITMKAWEWYSRMMLADKAHDFLLLCDDGEWKLWEWSTRSYPSWHRNRFAVAKEDATQTPETGSTQELGTESDDANIEGPSPAGEESNAEEQSPARDNNDNDGDAEEQSPAGDSDNNNNAGELSPADGNGDVEGEPGNSGTQGASPSSNASITDRRTAPSSVVIDPFAPAPQSGPGPNNPPPPETNSSNNAPDAEDMPAPGSAATTTSNLPRVRLTLGRANNPTSDAVRIATDSDTGRNDCNTQSLPSEETADNTTSRTKGKKRTTESDASTASSKRQKKADAMAEPTGGNSIKNICMRQWNTTQPGGQGLLHEFDSYFKTLSEADKELFKKELRAAQVAARKVKTVKAEEYLDSDDVCLHTGIHKHNSYIISYDTFFPLSSFVTYAEEERLGL